MFIIHLKAQKAKRSTFSVLTATTDFERDRKSL